MKAYDVKKYYDVEFFNTRLNIPEKNMALDLKTGRFLGGDIRHAGNADKIHQGRDALCLVQLHGYRGI